MAPNATIWPLDGHTQGKHLVLKNYMDAWLPIMTKWNGRVLFIDAFAGPGKYSGGEHGSPVVALQSLSQHSSRNQMKSEILYVFIEKDVARAQHLQETLNSIELELPSNCAYEVINSTFDETLNEVLDTLEDQKKKLAPAFVMIDPFGVSGTPMKTIGRILDNPKSEVYISLMYREINRFMDHQNFESHLDELFGCTEWRQAIQIANSEERKSFIFSLYEDQLRNHGAKYVLHFELYQSNRLVYAIFFGTQDLAGCDKMKQAIWKVAPFGNYRFRSGQNSQLTLGIDVLDLTPLENGLKREFGLEKWINITDIEDFMKSDKTPFLSTHLKTKTLKPMESRGDIEVQEGTRNRASTYPAGTLLKFVQRPI